jgi:levanase/fructan beta-fructosidase
MLVDGTDDYKWVMLLSVNPGGPNGGSATQYFVGDFDGKHSL